MRIIDVKVTGCQVFGEGGFAQLRRCEARNVFADGSCSDSYSLDIVERPAGTDAVAVVPHDRYRVLLRRGLRPAIRLGRPHGLTREGGQAGVLHLEVVAGILEPQDPGEAGMRQRAAAELREEIGFRIEPREVQVLGPPVCLSPGLMAEQVYFCCVEVEPDALSALEQPRGDGSPLEQGGEAVILPLEQALEHCARGLIRDAKTELALRRLKDRLTGV